MQIRPHRHLPPRISVRLSAEFRNALRASQPERVQVDEDVYTFVEAEIETFTNGLRIDAVGTDPKAVTAQLRKVRTRIERALAGTSLDSQARWLGKLEQALFEPIKSDIEAERARRIAVMELETKVGAILQMRKGQPLTTAVPAGAASPLKSLKLDEVGLRLLAKLATQTIKEVHQTNAERRASLSQAIGVLQIDGNAFEFRPDPWREKGVRPSSQRTDEFVRKMIECYRWMGGQVAIHKHGPSFGAPTPFMAFLQSVQAAIPAPHRPKGDSLVRRAITIIEADRRAA